MRLAAVNTVETGASVAAMVQQQFEHGEVVHAKEHRRGKYRRLDGDGGVHVSSILQEEGRHLHSTSPDSNQQGVEQVQVGVGSSLQQHLSGFQVAVVDGEEERCAAVVLVPLTLLFRKLAVGVESLLQEKFQDAISVVLCGDVQRADAATDDSAPAGDGNQQGHDAEGTKSILKNHKNI